MNKYCSVVTGYEPFVLIEVEDAVFSASMVLPISLPVDGKLAFLGVVQHPTELLPAIDHASAAVAMAVLDDGQPLADLVKELLQHDLSPEDMAILQTSVGAIHSLGKDPIDASYDDLERTR